MYALGFLGLSVLEICLALPKVGNIIQLSHLRWKRIWSKASKNCISCKKILVSYFTQ